MSNSSDYTAVSLFSIPPDEPLPFSVYVYYRGHFMLYRTTGQVFEVAKYNRFIYKRISKLYISNGQLATYKEFARKREALEETKLTDPKLTAEQRVTNKTVRSLDLTVKELFIASDEELSGNVAKVVDVARNAVQRICEKPYLRIFDAIPESSNVIEHSKRVSLMATFLGYQLGFVNPNALEQLAAAGMLHDIGKTRVALGDDVEGNPAEEAEIQANHVGVGLEVLRRQGNVPEEVLRIIAEHHERRDGTGFPKKLRGRQLYGLSKVFSIANTFDSLVAEQKGDRETRYRNTALLMEREMRSWFEPMLLPKALKLLSGAG